MHKTFLAMKLAGALSCLCLLTGCFDTKQEFTINPDGSGKVVHECTFQKMDLSGKDDTSPEAMKEAIRKVMEEAKGVSAWKEVTYKRLEDGRLFFRGTAYFKNLSQLDIPNQTMLKLAWSRLGDGKGILSLNTNKTASAGNLSLRPASAKPLPGTPEELQQRLREEKAKFQQMKPMMTAILGGMKQELIVHLPGQVTEVSNFARTEGGLHLQFDGTKVMNALEQLLTNNTWLAKRIQAGQTGGSDFPELDDEVNGILFNRPGPVRAVVTAGVKTLFDYPAELVMAQQAQAKILKELGGGSVTIAPPAEGQPLKSVRVAGVRLVQELDKDPNLRPFNYDAGYTVAVLAELPGSILSVTDESAVQKALADDGSDLLPERAWDRAIHFPKLARDTSRALFEVTLKAPGPQVKGFKELSGTLRYTVASGTRELDLGLNPVKTGTAGTELGAKIQSIGEGWKKDGSQKMELKLNVNPDALRTVWLVMGENRTVLERRGYSGGGNTYTFTLESKQPFPAEARLVVELFDGIKSYDAPWKLENLTLLGQAGR